MTLNDELYFEITLSGSKADLKKFVQFIKSGELDEFFDMSSDYLSYADEYAAAPDAAETEIVFTNDDLGVEIGEFNPEEFLDVFCKATKNLDVKGHFYDLDDEEYAFTSAKGDAYYANDRAAKHFNDELDAEAYEEESHEDSEEI